MKQGRSGSDYDEEIIAIIVGYDCGLDSSPLVGGRSELT
jgi:hypothetical protein